MKFAILGLIFVLLFATFAGAVFGTINQKSLPSASSIFGNAQEQNRIVAENPSHASSVDIIHPQTGQFANYTQSQTYSNGTGWNGWWGMFYGAYVQPHLINVTQVIVRPELVNGTFWCTVDTTSRWITNSSPDFWWNGTWYVPWIETNVTVGSTINWYTDGATVVKSETLSLIGKQVNCWVVNSSQYEQSYYDKWSGLLMMYRDSVPGQFTVDMVLNETNIPVGQKLGTMVYFNLSPNPVSIGGTVSLKGILVDQFSKPLWNETVRLYARPLAGSWTYVSYLVTNLYGIFSWQVTVPSVPKGTYVFAVYYSGSSAYLLTYNFATLTVQ